MSASWLLGVGVLLVVGALVAVRRMGLLGPAREPAGDPAAWALTPFDEGAFDAFLSYKSDDVERVRPVADGLIASGLRPWFAEYMVLLAERDRFGEAIREGIRRSRHGVVFSNDRYARSEHCRFELDRLFEAEGPGAGRVVEVRMPDEPATRRYQPALRGAATLDHSGETSVVLAELGKRFGFTPAPSLGADGPERRLTLPGPDGPFSVDLGGWRVDWSSPARGMGGFGFRRKAGGRVVRFNLFVGPGTVAPRKAEGTLNEREVFDRSVEFAARYIEAHGYRPAGVHLYFLAGYSHLALTYWLRKAWVRRYSIVLPGKRAAALEYAFAFAFEGPFPAYCAAVGLMDRVVASLRAA